MGFDLTPLGLLIVPVTFIIIGLYPKWLLPWTFVLTPFQAASVLNIYIGGYPIGVQPGYFAASCFIVVLIIKLLVRGYARVPRNLLHIYTPLFAFVAYVIFSATVLPSIFEGTVKVYPPRAGLVAGNFVPLGPTPTNISQTFYLVFVTAFAVAVSLDVINFGKGRGVRYYLVPYLIAGSLVALIGFYQLAAAYFGVPYPYDLLYSNLVYIQHYDQTIGDIARLSSILTEPAQAAYYLVGVFFFALWLCLFTSRAKLALASCVLVGLALLLTTSTTAYLTLGVVWLSVLLQVFLRRGFSHRVIRLTIVATSVLILAVMTLYLLGSSEAISSIIDASLTNKTSSESYEGRSETSLHALSLLLPTGGFGVGWGSDRSSGLLFNMLSNAGIWGTALLAWFGLRVYRYVTETASFSAIDPAQRNLMRAFGFSVVAMLVAGLISVPDLTSMSLWLNLAVLMALALHAKKYQDQQAHSLGLTMTDNAPKS